jgi:hypothetical protein
MFLPPFEIVKAALPVSVLPEAVVMPPRTVICPPVEKVSLALKLISIVSLAAS